MKLVSMEAGIRSTITDSGSLLGSHYSRSYFRYTSCSHWWWASTCTLWSKVQDLTTAVHPTSPWIFWIHFNLETSGLPRLNAIARTLSSKTTKPLNVEKVFWVKSSKLVSLETIPPNCSTSMAPRCIKTFVEVQACIKIRIDVISITLLINNC